MDEDTCLSIIEANASLRALEHRNTEQSYWDYVKGLAAEAGIELSYQCYRTWHDLRNDSLGVDGLRHIVQPYLNYTYMPEPNQDKENLYLQVLGHLVELIKSSALRKQLMEVKTFAELQDTLASA